MHITGNASTELIKSIMFASNQIHAVEKIFQTFPVPPEDEGKVGIINYDFLKIHRISFCCNCGTIFQLLIFMMDLQGEPKGLSVGGLSVITKTLSLTVRLRQLTYL